MRERTLWVWVLALALGAVLWPVSLTGRNDPEAWRALLLNFLFFTSLAGGLVTWPAIVHASRGTWSEPIDPTAFSALSFAVPSLVLLALLWAGADHWAAWLHRPRGASFWLNETFVFARDLLSLGGFWLLALRYVRRRREAAATIWPGWLIIVYSAVLSLLGFDLVMALGYPWTSALFGAYFFISGLYIAVCGWALLSVARRKADERRRSDLGQLIVAFAVLTAYMAYCQLLTIWYENLPEETSFMVARMNPGPWHPVSMSLIGVVYLGPIVLLLTQWSKKNRWSLRAISLLLLAGLWVERWWLVDAPLQPKPVIGLAEVSSTLLALGAFGIGSVLTGRRPVPPPPGVPRAEEES